MKQVAGDARSGEVLVAEVPEPVVRAGCVLVATRASAVSAGTERSVLEFAAKGLLGKALARPDLLRQVWAKFRRDGLEATWRAVTGRLEAPLPLGYSAAGVVLEAGPGTEELPPGTRVACTGAGYAVHAERLVVPRNLAARIPDGVSDEAAAFGALGAIAIHGFRRAEVSLGESLAVVGLGAIGLLAAQVAEAAGVRAVGLDTDARRVELARSLGLSAALVRGEPEADATAARAVLAGRLDAAEEGFDAVLVAAASASSGPVDLAAELARDRGRIVALGAVALELPRRTAYRKELDLRLSRSTGPGRYDPAYEEKGLDYPAAYVRWTERRNLEEFLRLAASGRVRVEPFLEARFEVARAGEAYRALQGSPSPVGVLLTYPASPGEAPATAAVPLRLEEGRGEGAPAPAASVGQAFVPARPGPGQAGMPVLPTSAPAGELRKARGLPLGVGLIGPGEFARGTLLPLLAGMAEVRLRALSPGRGSSALSASAAASRFGVARAYGSPAELLADATIGAVVVATRHADHAELASAALRAGKDVFLEKPMALSASEIELVRAAAEESGNLLLVDFNRRFAPATRALASAFAARRPLAMAVRVNAGPLLEDHWLLDPEVGGGRILGEGCHFVDWLCALAGGGPVEVLARSLGRASSRETSPAVNEAAATIRFADGSAGTLLYAAGGSRAFPKERLEAFGGGVSAAIDDFRETTIFVGNERRRVRGGGKGHREALEAFVRASAEGSAPPIPLAALLASTRATFAILESIRTGAPVRLA